MIEENFTNITKHKHHEQFEYCTSRAHYRQGKKLTAVKVYTINNESQHILIFGVPAIGLQDDLHRMCSKFGSVASMILLPNYETEEFTEVYHVHFSRIQSARHAKKNLDRKEFYGGILHVCYAPEMESLKEVKEKLIQRRKDVSVYGKSAAEDNLSVKEGNEHKNYNRKRNHSTEPLLDTCPNKKHISEQSCIWNGVPSYVDPRIKESVMCNSNPFSGKEKLTRTGIVKMTNTHSTKSSQSVFQGNQVNGSNHNTIPSVTLSSTPLHVNSAMKFIPRQIKMKRIVFHNK